jgi:hypothetical protein
MRTESDNIKPTFVFVKKMAILNTAKEMTLSPFSSYFSNLFNP